MSEKESTNISDRTMEIISQRVADYKTSKEKSKLNADEVGSHVDALAEVFDLDKDDVERIAKDVIIKQEQQDSFKDKLLDKLIKFGKEIILTVIVVVIVSLIIFGRYTVPQQQQVSSDVNSSSLDHSLFIKKTKIINALNTINPLKVYLLDYYMNEGKYPQSFDDVGVLISDITEMDYIEDVFLGKEGGILVKMDQSIGDNLIVGIFPRSARGGTLIKWQCKTNFSGYLQGCEKTSMNKYLRKFNY